MDYQFGDVPQAIEIYSARCAKKLAYTSRQFIRAWPLVCMRILFVLIVTNLFSTAYAEGGRNNESKWQYSQPLTQLTKFKISQSAILYPEGNSKDNLGIPFEWEFVLVASARNTSNVPERTVWSFAQEPDATPVVVGKVNSPKQYSRGSVKVSLMLQDVKLNCSDANRIDCCEIASYSGVLLIQLDQDNEHTAELGAVNKTADSKSHTVKSQEYYRLPFRYSISATGEIKMTPVMEHGLGLLGKREASGADAKNSANGIEHIEQRSPLILLEDLQVDASSVLDLVNDPSIEWLN